MNKKQRELVFSKYGGKCAYCGCKLHGKWHLDHLAPVYRTQKRVEGFYRHKITKEKISQKDLPEKWFVEYEYINPRLVFDKMLNPQNDTVENSMPSCQSCNLYKSAMDIETFRENISCLVARLNSSFTQYKIAKRYGLIKERKKPIIFYFESITNK